MVGTFNSQHECRLTNDIFEGAINFTCIIVVAQFFVALANIYEKMLHEGECDNYKNQ